MPDIPAAPPLSPEEVKTLVGLARRALWAPEGIRRTIQAARVNVVPANFYSAIPTLDELDRSFERRAPGAPLFGAELFDAGAMAATIGRLARWADEFDPPVEGDREDPEGFFWANPAFSYSDAMAYYCMIRELRPAGIVEIGAGFSSLVADLALRRNGSGRLTLIEPHPKPFLRRLQTLDRLIEARVQDLAIDLLADLVAGAGCLFIDSTHTVKAGSDCLWIYLRLLPALRTGTVVHAHDIHLPFAMPPAYAAERHIYWTEQYLLCAYLLDNPRAEVLFSSAFALAALPQALREMMRGRHDPGGGSIWFRLGAAARAGAAPPAEARVTA
ncbi:MAG: class I SAM-dependent methyltransferase [Rhodobacteraceae bacterium]|nr:class I SAM-dependent methyltransferase [Paracoccaceae bacterium]